MQDVFAYCEAQVRAADKDRFISCLFAPAEHRAALFALYAFNTEIARVREVVREPLAGEMRLQWWSDAIGGRQGGDARAHPVAAAMLATADRYALPADALKALIEARRFDLYREPMATLDALDAYAEGASSDLIALAGQILNAGRKPDIAALARHGGIAHAVAGLLNAFPVQAARDQLFVPLEILARHGADRRDIAAARATPQLRAALAELRDYAFHHLFQAQELSRSMPEIVTPALLPVALVGPALARMARRGYDPFVPVKIASWKRQWLIWRAARRPSRIFA